jgi:16S rRNA (guanine966-N2)-methyltransferase
MRIISGKYKGQLLNQFSADHIRPTTDRVKETLFNILQNDLPGARVLDLFAGTGNLGLEALSRGAEEVIFVESHPKSLEIIRKNLKKLQVSEVFQIVNKDVLRFLEGPFEREFDVIFADPPFTKQMADEVMTLACQSALFGDKTIMAIESARREKLEQRYGDIVQSDQRIFGDKILSFFVRRPVIE